LWHVPNARTSRADSADRKQIPQADWALTGATAGSYDFNQRMKQRMPIVLAFVLGLAFLLMAAGVPLDRDPDVPHR
jgi:uncharacterized membrane protein YdfJ with MMPL/SSD domain